MATDTRQLLTHSRQQSFKTCRRRHWWEYEIGLRRETDAKALRIGTAGHAGIDCLNHGCSVEAAINVVRSHYQVCPESCDPAEWEIERETIECLVSGYQWRWGGALEIIASERAFALPLLNPATGARSTNWDVAGRIDGICRMEDGRLAVIEHKFISDALDPDGDFWRRLQLDSQISLYVWAARQLGHEVEAVLYDCIRKPTIRPEQVPLLDAEGLRIVLDASGHRVMTKQGKPRQTGSTADGYTLQTRPMTPDEWGQKLLDDIGQRSDFYYARIEIPRLDGDIAEMQAELWDIQKTIREAQRYDRWYKTVGRDSCPWCSFFGLCSSRFDPSTGETPEGFVRLSNPHPELESAT